MRDPLPDNIDGQKVVSHEVQHSVDWGHVALGVAAIYAIWKGAQLLGGGSDDVEDGEPHQQVRVEPKNQDSAGHTGW